MKDILLEFYVNKFNFLTDSNEINIDFIPQILRRRLSNIDKCALYMLNQTYSNDVQNIVFSSQYGEVERLNKLIGQYTKDKEVSPNTFSGSVHNYSEGFFLLNKKNPVPYTAISAGENSISMGFLTAILSNYNNILFCYSDYFDNEHSKTFAVNLAKKNTSQAIKYQIKMKQNTAIEDEFDGYVKLFCGDIKSLNTSTYTIERVGDDKNL
jgi:hypothetical protein